MVEKKTKIKVKASPGITSKTGQSSGKSVEPKTETNSSYDMLSWQFKTLLGQIQQIKMHERGDCPCILNTQDPPERCLGKHLLNISTLSRETANMSKENKKWLIKLAGEANARHEQFRKFICHTKDLPELTDWARNWRKQYLEPVYYACRVEPPAETKPADSSSKLGKPADRNVPAKSCTMADLKN